MATTSVTTSTELRNAIQLAGPGDVITLSGAGPFSVGTLAKLTSTTLTTNPGGEYTIVGNGTQVITDTRIYQANIDGPNAPSIVKDLTLNYTSGNSAILNAKTGSYTIDNVSFTGTHTGWAGNGNNYISLTVSNPLTPTTSANNSTLIFKDSDVSINGKPGNGFNGTSGGAAFIQSWNNMGGATLQNNIFDESGYLAAFQFFNSPAAATNLGIYTITGNTFSRTTDKTVRSRGERLENVEAMLSDNIFNDGSYLDLYGNVSGVEFNNNNTFNTIAGGYGIRTTQVSGSTGATLAGIPMFNGTLTFTGPGLPIKYISSTSPSPDGSVRYAAVNGFIVNGVTFDRLSAGSQVDDTITTSGSTIKDWVNGDDGNDTISTSGGNDFALGGTGNDTINGGADNDTIEGGSGADSLDGGTGNDTLCYASSSSGVTVNLNSNTASGGDATGDTIINFENMIGSAFADKLDGNSGANIIDGGAGNDTLAGGVGNDTITGGTGADIFRTSSGTQTDRITDFNTSQSDRIGCGSVTFANSTPNSTLNSLDVQHFATLSAFNSSSVLTNKVSILDFDYTVAQMNAFTSTAGGAGYVLFYDTTSGKAQLFYDGTWQTDSTSPGRQNSMFLDGITSSAAVAAFTNNQFFYG